MSESAKARARANIKGFLESLGFIEEVIDWRSLVVEGQETINGEVHYPPTPEQVLDNGRIDHIPAITANVYDIRHEIRIRRKENEAKPKQKFSPNAKFGMTGRPGCRVIRSDGAIFDSISKATDSVGGQPTTLMRKAREGLKYLGFFWTIMPPKRYAGMGNRVQQRAA
jgi:hypothetical protein